MAVGEDGFHAVDFDVRMTARVFVSMKRLRLSLRRPEPKHLLTSESESRSQNPIALVIT